ncbi:MAG: hypothetical protein GTO24_20985 [candidate division Zixibacteria bacterium]|nr:hypothetical protein [candidate division Zixibacteria bacterium]
MSYPPILESYKRWWCGKYCRLTGSHGEFKYVLDVKFHGPPSGVYGSAELIFAGGERETIRVPANVYKPRKSDVEVWPHDDPPPRIEDK